MTAFPVRRFRSPAWFAAVCIVLAMGRCVVAADPTVPLLMDSFEETGRRPDQPAGWHYARHAQVAEDPAAPDGGHCLSIACDSPGRDAEIRRSVPLDGRSVGGLDLSVWVRCRDVRPGQFVEQRPQLIVDFYAADHRSLGQDHLGPWFGTFDWREERAQVPVPSGTRFVLIRLGLFGGMGEASFDHLVIVPLEGNPTVFPAKP